MHLGGKIHVQGFISLIFHELLVPDFPRSLTQEQALKLGSQAAIDHVYPSAVPLER